MEEINQNDKPKKLSVWHRIRHSFWSFVVLYMIFSMTHGILGSYSIPILTTLEKKFNLPSFISGTMVTLSAIGYLINAPLMSYFIPNHYKVKTFAFAMLGTSVCSLLYLVPHFLYPTVLPDAKNLTYNHESTFNEEKDYLCYSNVSDQQYNFNHDDDTSINNKPNWVAIGFMSVSEILHGLVGAPIWAIGVSMLDDYAPVALSSKLIGMLYLMRFLSPVSAFAMGSYFLSIPTDLKETSLNPTHPDWVGAWWLGFIVCFFINILLTIPTFLMADELEKLKIDEPKVDTTKDNPQNEIFDVNEQCEIKNETISDEVNFLNDKNIEENELNHNNDIPIQKRNFQDLFLSIYRSLKNPTYLFMTLGVCLDCYALPFYTFLPKYVEVYFRTTAWKAGLYGGMLPSVASALASYFGGIISGKIKLTKTESVKTNIKFSIAFSALSACTVFCFLFIPCTNNYLPFGYDSNTKSVSMNNTCNTDCSCDINEFKPACGSNNTWLISPCQAGCKNVDFINDTEVYNNCSCLEDATLKLYSGYCDESCDKMLIVFLVVLVVFCFSGNLYNVAITNATLYCVPDEDKSLSFGLQSTFICLTILPASMFYGCFIDLSCILWKTSEDEDSTGSCLAYEHSEYRNSFFGLLLLFRIITVLLYLLSFFFAYRKAKQVEKLSKKSPIITNIE